MFQCTRKLTLHAGRCQKRSSVGINLFDSLWPLSFVLYVFSGETLSAMYETAESPDNQVNEIEGNNM